MSLWQNAVKNAEIRKTFVDTPHTRAGKKMRKSIWLWIAVSFLIYNWVKKK